MCWTIFPAFLGAEGEVMWVQLAWETKGPNPIVLKDPANRGLEPAGTLVMLDNPSLQAWLWSRCVCKTAMTAGVSDTGRQVWDLKNTDSSGMTRCVRSSSGHWTPGGWPLPAGNQVEWAQRESTGPAMVKWGSYQTEEEKQDPPNTPHTQGDAKTRGNQGMAAWQLGWEQKWNTKIWTRNWLYLNNQRTQGKQDQAEMLEL